MFALVDYKKLPLITFIVSISSLCQITKQLPVAQNFGGFDSLTPLQQVSPLQQLQKIPAQQNFLRQPNINQNFRTDSRLNFGQNPVFASTTAAPVVYFNNQLAVTMVPFIEAATTPTPQFLDCFSRCPTTSEFNPICASNRQQYGNEAKFNCAQRCGADIQIVRRGGCQGLFPISRG